MNNYPKLTKQHANPFKNDSSYYSASPSKTKTYGVNLFQEKRLSLSRNGNTTRQLCLEEELKTQRTINSKYGGCGQFKTQPVKGDMDIFDYAQSEEQWLATFEVAVREIYTKQLGEEEVNKQTEHSDQALLKEYDSIKLNDQLSNATRGTLTTNSKAWFIARSLQSMFSFYKKLTSEQEPQVVENFVILPQELKKMYRHLRVVRDALTAAKYKTLIEGFVIATKRLAEEKCSKCSIFMDPQTTCYEVIYILSRLTQEDYQELFPMVGNQDELSEWLKKKTNSSMQLYMP